MTELQESTSEAGEALTGQIMTLTSDPRVFLRNKVKEITGG